MASVDRYLELADRPNTQRSYAATVQHFETEWRGLLPATPESVAEYLAAYAPNQAVNTLHARLAGLSRWHQDHGFQDPTKSPLVRRVFRGIRTAHTAPQKQARPLEFEILEQVSNWLDEGLPASSESVGAHRAEQLRFARDQAILLLGFWRGFRSDELTGLRFENIEVDPGVGLTCFIPRSKTDHLTTGETFQCPALSRLCPVAAFTRWKAMSGFNQGPVFRRIDRWGHVSESAVAPKSVVPWLRSLFVAASVDDAGAYSSHSLRHGLANWAKSSGWDVKELMTYVGWKDFNSALRYLDDTTENVSRRFERGLAATKPRAPRKHPQPPGSAPLRRTAGDTPSAKVVQLPVKRQAK